MTVEKTAQGAWVISDIIDNQLVRRVYFFYTKREAIQNFRKEVKA